MISGWFLLASAIVQYQRKIKLLNQKNKLSSSGRDKGNISGGRGKYCFVPGCGSLR